MTITERKYEFDDLVFEEMFDGLRHNALFKHNDKTLSVAYGRGNYGSGPSESGGTYEIAMWYDDDPGTLIQLDEHDEVLGWQSEDHVTKIMTDMQNGLFDR